MKNSISFKLIKSPGLAAYWSICKIMKIEQVLLVKICGNSFLSQLFSPQNKTPMLTRILTSLHFFLPYLDFRKEFELCGLVLDPISGGMPSSMQLN